MDARGREVGVSLRISSTLKTIHRFLSCTDAHAEPQASDRTTGMAGASRVVGCFPGDVHAGRSSVVAGCGVLACDGVVL